MNFEESFKKFEEIVKKLEGNDLPLNDAISLFEQGVLLLKNCYELLGEAKGKISVLTKELDEITLKPLDLNEDKNK